MIICSQCSNEMDFPKHTGRILATRVGNISYDLCSDKCLEKFYMEILDGILGRHSEG